MPAINNLQDLFSAFANLKVLVIGDVMLDAYVWGKTERISPEAPVPIVKVTRRENRLGGAANVALNIQALGGQPMLCSIVGDDEAGTNFVHLLEQQQIATNGIIQSQKRITTVKERILSGSQHILRVDHETENPLDPLEEKTLINHIQQLIDQCHVVIFEDYDKGALNERVISAAIEHARSKGIPTAVDPKRKNFLHYKGATLFKPNLKELREGLKQEDIDPGKVASVARATAALRQVLQPTVAMITLSDKGIYIENQAEQHHLPAHIRKISDVSGAGDTVISIAAMCLALDLPLQLTAALANLGGGLVCEHLGVVPVNKEQLLQEAQAAGLMP